MRPLRIIAALGLAVACTVLGAPAALAGGGGGGGSICDGFSRGDDLTMYDSCFAGTAQLVDPDTASLTVTNDGVIDHTVTATDGSFDLYVRAGESATLDLPEDAVIPVYCTLHGSSTGSGMAGVIVRTSDGAAGAVAPASAGESAAGDGIGQAADISALGGSDGDSDGIAVVALVVAGIAAALSATAALVAAGARRSASAS